MVAASVTIPAKAPGPVFWPLLAVVLLAPLPFAAAPGWAWPPLAALTAATLAVWAVLLAAGRATLAVPPGRIALPLLLFACVVGWIVAQMSPGTPPSWHHPAWGEAGRALGAELAGSISIDRHATLSALLRLLWYAGVFWLALQLCRNADAARRALGGLVLAAAAYAGYGLAIDFSDARMVLWVDKFFYHDVVTSTFINRNSYASYAGIGLIAVTALIVRRIARAPFAGRTLATRIADAIAFLFAHNWHLLAAWAVVASALILTASRAGVVSSLVGLFAFLAAMAASRRRARGVVLATFLLVPAALAGFFLVSGADLARRLAHSVGATDLRLQIFDITLSGVVKWPLLGTGYGTFAKAFESLQPAERSYSGAVLRAHNTYLENALELGLPAAAALVLSIALLARICWRGVRRRKLDAYYPALGVGASALVGAHSLVDFSLQIPAVSVTYAFVLGLACAQSWSSRDA